MPEKVKENLSFRAVGGGHIIHTNINGVKDMFLYGYSVPYGKGDHEKNHYILGQEFGPLGYKVRWSNSPQCTNKYEHLHKASGRMSSLPIHNKA